MKRFGMILLSGLVFLGLTSVVDAQTYQRKVVDVPKVDPLAITIDGVMNEGAWATAGQANLVTPTGFEMFMFPYDRPGLPEPEYDELYARLLWALDTLYVFINIDEFVNDSTDLYWDGQWIGDQLFVSISNRLGVEMKGWYDGNVYASPDGPYHFLILGDQITLNNGAETWIPDEYKNFPDDTTRVFDPADIARWATTINTATGQWTVEMAIYNPHVNAGSRVAFNMGGSTGSTVHDTAAGDAYAYYCWVPSVVDSPYTQPQGVPIPDWGADPGYYNLASSSAWALLNFLPGAGDYVRRALDVPMVAEGAITVDGVMNEAAWATAGQANLVTPTGFEMFMFPYDRPGLPEPEYDEFYARLLWSLDTLYAFINIDEFVNDSTDLYWDGQWIGDQLFVSLSNRLGVEMKGWYDGNVYAAPDGPYHFLILGDQITLNNGAETWIPDEYMKFPDDTTRVFDPADIARWATAINTATGEWMLELAIYNPNVNLGGRIGFNVGGSTGSTVHDTAAGDAYAYYCWVPSVVDSPYTQPQGVPIPDWGADPGYYNLASSSAWALLTFVPEGGVSGIVDWDNSGSVPSEFALAQNYPNPFNPSTTIYYRIGREAKVVLSVYNLLGQEVTKLVDNVQRAGTYQAVWNAVGNGTGVYFYQLTVDDNVVDTKKMVLLK